MDVKILLKNYAGWGAIIILSVIPVFLLALGKPLLLNLYSLGKIAGLVGMAMFSLMVILSARLKIFEKVFFGINQAYIAHHFYGGIAFSLLLFHPLLLGRADILFFLPSSYWPKNFGIFALFLMIIILATTFYVKQMIKYQNWKLIHQFMGLAFAFAFLHILLIGSDIAQNPALKFYMFFLAGLAILAYLYRTIFGVFLIKKYNYLISSIKNLPDNTNEVALAPAGAGIKHESGQFVFIKIKSKNISGEIHPFTISSAPSENNLRLSIKESGDWTGQIKNLAVGDKAKVEGPYGKFNFRNFKNKKQIWIAGGIGITPFLSMMRGFKPSDVDFNVDFYYSVKDPEKFIFLEEIKGASQKFSNFKPFFWESSANGLLTAGAVKQETPDLLERDILICGPHSMMSALKSQFLKLGAKKYHLHTEEFQL